MAPPTSGISHPVVFKLCSTRHEGPKLDRYSSLRANRQTGKPANRIYSEYFSPIRNPAAGGTMGP